LNLGYELARLGTEYFLSGFLERYRKQQPLPPPRYVLWDCTRRCNLKCLHCGAVAERYPSELTTPQIKTIIDQLSSLHVDMFAVTGGEPLLRADLLDVLSYAREQRMKTGIATNGFLVTSEIAQRIQLAGITSVQVSLDGMAATHNRIRGHPESFERAVDAIEHLVQASIPIVTVATTVTPNNLDQLETMHQFLIGMKVRQWRLVSIMPIGRAGTGGLALDGDQFVRMLSFVQRVNGKDLRVLIGENLPFLGAWEKKVRRGPLLCPVGFTTACIGVNGSVRGCPEMPDDGVFQEGSLLDKPFAEIWQTGFKRYRDRKILETDPRCAACHDQQACYGGCWVMRTGKLHCIRDLLTE